MFYKICIGLIFLSLQPVFAQQVRGKVVQEGNVEKGIPFAKIHFVDRDITILSDSIGNWIEDGIPLGLNHVVIKASGFRTKHIDIKVQVDSFLLLTLEPLHHELDKVIVSNNGYLHRESITNVESASMKDLNGVENTTLGQSISNIPGVYQTSIGVGVSKPVIRGLSGSSVITYVNGLRIQNQQWGSDHGLPITSLGIGGVEVIKGPASLLYGADALGGVLYFVDEPYEEKNNSSGFVSSRFESNSLGISNQAGIKYAKDKFRINVFGGYDNFADYQVPNGEKVLNSRFNQSSAKLAIGYAKKNWVFDFRYNFYQGRIGLPGHTHDSIPDVASFLTQNQNRDRNVPAQVIQNNFLSVENKFFFKNQEVYITLGNTNNSLKEHEEKFFFPDIVMNLNNSLYNIKWRSKISKKVETIFGTQGMLQFNQNGAEAIEILIPDAQTGDVGIYGMLRYKLDKYHFLVGARYDNRRIETSKNLFSGTYNGFNYSAGGARLGKKSTIRFNISSGFRAPNSSELLSDGIHHGSFRYERGNTLLKTEKAVQVDGSVAFHFEDFELIVNPFYNVIQDYIYLERGDSTVNQFQVYNYAQTDFAQLYGVDAGFHYHPHAAHWIHIESSISNVFAEDKSRNPLPLIPQTRLNSQFMFELEMKSKFRINNITIQHKYFFKQNRLGLLETETSDFHLLNFSLNMIYALKNPLHISVGARNILNTNFIDHLSQLKDLAITNPGFNVYCSIKYQFRKQSNK